MMGDTFSRLRYRWLMLERDLESRKGQVPDALTEPGLDGFCRAYFVEENEWLQSPPGFHFSPPHSMPRPSTSALVARSSAFRSTFGS